VIETLERMLFYGPRHAKRGQGIHELPARIRNNRPGYSFTQFCSAVFHSHALGYLGVDPGNSNPGNSNPGNNNPNQKP
jgi:hypothetical protein